MKPLLLFIKKGERFTTAIFLGVVFSLLIAYLFIQSQTLNYQAQLLNQQSSLQSSKLISLHQANLTLAKIASKSALRKSQGVNTATVEAALADTREQVASGDFINSVIALGNLDKILDRLYDQKIATDKAAAETARFQALADAKKKATISQPLPTPAANTDPTNLSFGYHNLSLRTNNGTFTVNLIKVNLTVARVFTDSANDNDCANNCPTLPLSDYVSRNSANFGINGTYFCPPDYASCAGKVASFDFPIYNSRLNKWINQANLYWINRAMITFNAGSATFYQSATTAPTSGYQAAIVNFPGLVNNSQDITGQYQLTDYQNQKGAKGGIGIKGNTLYLVNVSGASVSDLASVFMTLGVDSALNTDGGGSSALWAGGYKVGPGRLLPNALVIAGGQ